MTPRTLAIRAAVADGMSVGAVAARYGVSRQRVSQILQPFGGVAGHRRTRPVEVIHNDRQSRVIRKFWSKVTVREDGCWEWTGPRRRLGYGAARLMGEWHAHRITYRIVRGDIPAELELDHLCRRPWCVNPDHLEAVTHAENIRRGHESRRVTA